MKMPRSWLTPAWAVHRSAFPVRIAYELAVGVKVNANVLVSIDCQVTPSLWSSRYCCQLTAGGTKMKRSAGDAALVPATFVTATSTVPTASLDVAAVMLVLELTVKFAAGLVPKLTPVT